MALTTSPSRMRTALLAAVGIAAAIALSGCSLIQGLTGGGVRDDEGTITEESTTDIFQLKVGDCFMDESSTTIESLTTVPCTESHDNEVFYEFDLPEGEFPGQEAIDASVEAECIPAFNSFVGIDWNSSTLNVFSIYPTTESWAGGDRLVQCAVFDPAGPVTGTLAGAAR